MSYTIGIFKFRKELIISTVITASMFLTSCQRILTLRSGESVSSDESVMKRIEDYQAPSRYKETYDRRLENNSPVPPSLSTTLYCDILINLHNKYTSLDVEDPVGTIKKIIDLYVEEEWRKKAGYRPWTHTNFIRTLNDEERDRLAKEVLQFGIKNDFPPCR